MDARRRADVADAGSRSRAGADLLLHRKRVARPRRLRPRRGQSLRRFDRRARREDREAPLALPAGAPRHLGLRRAEPGRALRRRVRRRGAEGARADLEDRLDVRARPRDGRAAAAGRGGAGAAGSRAAHRTDAADPAVPAVHPARHRRGGPGGDPEARARGDDGVDAASGALGPDLHAVPPGDACDQPRPAGRRQLAADELQP